MRKLALLAATAVLLTPMLAAAQDATPEATPDTAMMESTMAPEADASASTLYVPIGGFYTTLYDFAGLAIERLPADAERVYMLMLPMTFSYDPEALTAADLIDNTQASERRRRQLEEACSEQAPEGVPCEVVVPPIYTREAAEVELALDYFTDDLAGVYFLGGDQVIAMQITANTPLETALADAYARGVVMGGNSAGLAIGSRAMIAGYGGDDFGPENAFDEGAVLVWNSDQERGLSFGLTDAILEQHLWERARLGRSLTALADPNAPDVVIGVDSFTGASIVDNARLEDVFGLYSAAVIDGETLGAADNASFVNGVLSIRNVLVHLIPPGDFGYDITTRQPTQAPALTEAGERMFEGLNTSGAEGQLFLGGGFDRSGMMLPEGNALTLVMGYTDAAAAEAAGQGDAEGAMFLAPGAPLPDLTPYQSVTVIAGDVSLLAPQDLVPLADFWRTGGDLLLMGDAAAIAGITYTAMPPTPYDSEDDLLIEAATQGTFLEGGVTVANGLGLIGVNIETRVMSDNRFGRMFALAVNTPEIPVLGLNDGGALEISSAGAVVGEASLGVIALDLRSAAIGIGTNGGFAVANGLIDVFAPGEAIAPN